jgi:hypothetical protein
MGSWWPQPRKKSYLESSYWVVLDCMKSKCILKPKFDACELYLGHRGHFYFENLTILCIEWGQCDPLNIPFAGGCRGCWGWQRKIWRCQDLTMCVWNLIQNADFFLIHEKNVGPEQRIPPCKVLVIYKNSKKWWFFDIFLEQIMTKMTGWSAPPIREFQVWGCLIKFQQRRVCP